MSEELKKVSIPYLQGLVLHVMETEHVHLAFFSPILRLSLILLTPEIKKNFGTFKDVGCRATPVVVCVHTCAYIV